MSARRWSWLALAVLVALIACDPETMSARFYAEDFETLCEGAPCGWERTSGDATQATWIETIHPGEHGLRLEGQVSVRGPGSEATGASTGAGLSLVLIGRCDVGSTLRVDVVLEDERGGTFIASAIAEPEPEWSPPLAIELVSDSARANATRVTAIGIAKTGSGACELSELTIDALAFTPGC